MYLNTNLPPSPQVKKDPAVPNSVNSKELFMLAPMEGVVCPYTRKILAKHSPIDVMTSEFVRVTSHLLKPRVFFKYAPELGQKNSYHFYIQLLGSNPTVISENAALALELGADGIDLNFGCPAKTVNRHEGGSKLLTSPQKFYDIISEVKKVMGPKPFSVKIRLGYEDLNQLYEICSIVQDINPTQLIVHARTKTDGYKYPARWEYFYHIDQWIGEVPLVVNGNINSLTDYKNIQKLSTSNRYMMGRGLMANPLLIKSLKNQCTFADHEINLTRVNCLYELLDTLTINEPKKACRRIKQWVRYFDHVFFKDAFQILKKINNPYLMKKELLSLKVLLEKLNHSSRTYDEKIITKSSELT